MVDVSVIIPTKNRSHCIERTLKSVYNQSIKNIEIIIIDDASTDNTSDIINRHQNREKISIRYIKNEISAGGAVARNQGAELAKGKYISFLDSDDEWLPNHLSVGIKLLETNKSDGVYGAFYTQNKGGELSANNIKEKPFDMNMADYIFSGIGDTRTSTFIFQSKCFKAVMFDEKQHKHQDWDLAIRFEKQFKLTINKERTVILHYDSNNRMSGSLNHDATEYLLSKHGDSTKPKNLVNFYLFLIANTIKLEGKTDKYHEYQQKLTHITKNNKISLTYKQNIKRYIFRYVPVRIIKKYY